MADIKAPVAPQAAPETGQQNTNGAESPPASNPGMDLMAKKERQLRKMQQDLQKQKQELETRAKSYETDYIPRSKLKEDPWSVLQNEGMDYDQLTQQLLQQPQDPATKALMSKIKALEEKQLAVERQAQEATQAQYTQAIKQISNDVKMLIDADAEYESVKSLGQSGIDAVVELIEQTFQTDGYLMDHAEAAAKIENYLVEEGYKMAQLKKVQARLAPKAPEVPVPQAKQASKAPTVTTLTHGMQTQTKPSTDAKARRERALAAFHGKLNE